MLIGAFCAWSGFATGGVLLPHYSELPTELVEKLGASAYQKAIERGAGLDLAAVDRLLKSYHQAPTTPAEPTAH